MKRSLLCALALLLLPHAPARAIEDGFDAVPCAWPEVVRLVAGRGPVPVFDGPSPVVCSGVYIGGHTVLTAAACIDASPVPHEVHWGEALGGDPNMGSQRLRMAIPLDDCRLHPVLPLAACTLREQPTMQAIPLLAPCEVDEVLIADAELFVVGNHQDKQWAHAMLPEAVPSSAIAFDLPDTIWTTEDELSSQVLQPDDRGGPLYVRAPDGSLRLAAIALDVEPAQWLASWQLTEWLLDFEDPEVVLPCHTMTGTWSPSSACSQLITDRSLGEGAWGREPAVCTTAQVIAPTPTCE